MQFYLFIDARSFFLTIFSINLAEQSDTDEHVTDISVLYQIIADEVLGSGQFGTVYGGIPTLLFFIINIISSISQNVIFRSF